ncbi:MDR family MFS transporter [Rhodococcus sp. KRD162]|uniref:MDR family MFS transporter n=1 Tax=Rhodococcus sp. KRD162 TaxID=2729725 RepID=UPI0019D06707|nr:MDR family MFS transporter [Rhodococcus sp. KRD162]
MATTDSSTDVGFRSERGPILIALMLSSALVALDATIIATAVLAIVGDLGGFAQFPWLFSIYLLAQAVSVPLYGKLADLFGRKKIMLFGIAVFCLGSILCGLAWSMPALIVFRAVQGLGAGAVQPMAITIAGDIYTLTERAKVQGYLASVWAVSSVLGPALGGVFSEYLSWRWIFFINIPLCALAAFMLLRKFVEGAVERSESKIDYLGAGLLTVGATMVLLGLLEGGQSWAWGSPISFAIFVGGFVLLGIFAWVESRAEEPILPLWVFTRRVLVVSSVISMLVGALILGLTSYVPTFVQGVFGTGAIVAGFSLSTLTLGWPIAASQSGRVYLRFGFRRTALIGGSIGVVGTALTTLLDAQSQIWHVAAMCFVIGLGMGLIASPTLIAAQSSVGWAERGVVTSTNMFARSLGSAVGVAVFGAIVNARVSGSREPEQLSDAIHLVFIGVLVAAVIMTVTALLMPKPSTP